MLERLVRPEVKDIIPYDAPHIPYTLKLDANESPFDLPISIRKKIADFILERPNLNIYPDSNSNELRECIAKYWNVEASEIIVGNGSDQIIQLLVNTFIGKDDKVLCPVPSFVMYKLTSQIAGASIINFNLDAEDFSWDIEKFIEEINSNNIKLAFLCTPNNPTGGIIPNKDILKVLEKCPNTVIVVDEAYGEFYSESMVPYINQYKNLVVLRTLSKAFGLAGIRCGYSISSKEMARELNKVKPPYNIGLITQFIAKAVLDETDIIKENIKTISDERDNLAEKLSNISGIKVFTSRANFVLIKVTDSSKLLKALLEKGILVRGFGNAPVLENCVRLTVGTREQNELLINEITNNI